MTFHINYCNLLPGSDALATFHINNYAHGDHSFVGNGQYNNACGKFSYVGNGGGVDTATPSPLGNEAHADYSFIGNGVTNQVTSQSAFSFIGDGCQNKIGGSIAGALGAEYGFIGSGQNNCIDTGTAMSTLTPFGVIGGGQNNKICAGTCYSSIVGGQDNCVLHNWATVAGCGVTSLMDCAFHTNVIISTDMPSIGASPAGTLMYLAGVPGVPAGYCVVVTC
jgi:hypothetical protein